MLNFICSIVDELDDVAYFIVVAISFIICAFSFIKRKMKEIDKTDSDIDDDDDDTSLQNSGYGLNDYLNDQQRSYLNSLQQRKNAQQPKPSVTVGDGHAHYGTVETYEPIVGSLGSVSDEGCDELDGVRLIATDIMYETDDDHTAYDLDAIGKSIVLGEVLNNPRFKTPYGKR